jgi:hypothetical protein
LALLRRSYLHANNQAHGILQRRNLGLILIACGSGMLPRLRLIYWAQVQTGSNPASLGIALTGEIVGLDIDENGETHGFIFPHRGDPIDRCNRLAAERASRRGVVQPPRQ